MSSRSLIAISFAVSLAVTGIVAGPAIAANPDTPIPGVADSASLSTPVVVSGTVAAADGQPAAGTPVVIRVWPASEVLGKLPVGSPVATQNVAVAVTDATGGYALRVDPSRSLAAFADPSGIVSFDVVAGYGTASTSFGVTRSLTELTAAAGTAAARSVQPAQVNLTLGAADASSRSLAASGGAPAAIGCSLQKIGTYGAVWTVVGETYTHPGSTATFTYTSGSSSTLGIGISSGSGIFTASGTSSTTSTATLGFPTTPTNSARQWRTQFQYDKFNDLCGHIYARPTSFLGGTGIVFATTISATNCTSQLAGSSFTKSSTNASTLSVGVDSSSVIGIDLSAQTGFTTTAKVKYTFSSAGKMCGSAGFPGASPGRLAAKS